MKKKLIISLALFMCGMSLFGQKLNGIITTKKNKPIEGAYISILKNNRHSHTSPEGRFTISGIIDGDTLLISHIGYQKKLVIVHNPETTLSIELSESLISIGEIVINQKINALNLIAEVDLHVNPVNTSQEVLRQVPGLVIGQHAGGGKAEQIFLRGFDIDHGTDINISVDELPVNMVSHAHGQGYADLHFLIPETIEKIDFGKGTYYAGQGNLTTAGYVNFKTKDHLDNSILSIEMGQFNTQRLLGMFNIANQLEHSAYLATEFNMTDGAFDSPQNFHRINLMGKYTAKLKTNDKLSLLASYFTSKWDASGQIPQRAVDNGSITRFGAIDDTEGGNTSRANILLQYNKYLDDKSFIKNSVFYSLYDFELYSNFTFFLNDPINGDEIRQKESRGIYGLKSEYHREFDLGKSSGSLVCGLTIRNDDIKNIELTHTKDRRQNLEEIQLGDIHETNFGAYLNASFDLGKWNINPGIRIDRFEFNYNDHLQEHYQTQNESKSILSPKLNILYNYSHLLQLYLKTGKGFHSNDTRVVVANNGKEILPAAYGADLGFLWKPVPKMLINTALWNLFLEQEFVYVGDEGVVEPSGKTNRQGIDLSIRYQLLEWLFWDFDANYTLGKAIDEPKDMDYIPLAPDFTFMSGLNIIHPSGLYGGINFRYVDDRPANEDNSIVAVGYGITDLHAGYKWGNFNIELQIQNLFDKEWNETQFATESKLFDESHPVEEIHFIPGVPFFSKLKVSYKF